MCKKKTFPEHSTSDCIIVEQADPSLEYPRSFHIKPSIKMKLKTLNNRKNPNRLC